MYSDERNKQTNFDPSTKPVQPVQRRPSWSEPKPRRRCGCCLFLFTIPILLVILLTVWVFLTVPGRTNILVLGIDSREDTNLGRSDTNILMTFVPSEPYVGMLSIPRDLWVTIPGRGPNRINTAHFFAEAQEPGTGPNAAMETVRTNFGVDVHHYVRIHHVGLLDLIDALGGINVVLPRPMSGYDAGTHHLSSEQALALVRDRAGSDDFLRMERGQIFLVAVIKKLVAPTGWAEIPTTWKIISDSLDTDIPLWKMPQISFAILRVGTEGIDGRVIDRELVNPFVTNSGANVLAPNWDLINPVLMEMFGQ